MSTPARNFQRTWIRHDRSDKERRRAILREFYETEGDDLARDQGSAELDRFDPRDVMRPPRANTDRAYTGDQAHYKAACARAKIDVLQPTRTFWKKYFTGVAKPKKGPKPRYGTVQRHAFGIANLFFQHGLPSPTRTFFHRKMMRELAQLDERQTKKAKPLYGKEAKRLLDSYKKEDLRTLRNRAIAALGTTRGFRAATIVGLRIEHTTFEGRGVVLGLRDEKASVTRELFHTATRHTAKHRYCLPCILKEYVDALAELGVDEGPLFRAIDRWDNLHGTELSTKSITDLLRSDLARAGFSNARDFSSHSYRHGVVKTAVLERWSVQDIMLVTLHRSERGLRAYLVSIDPWQSAPRRSVFDSVVIESDDVERGWVHAV
jgi:site-specific recombinase XerD